MSLHSLNSMLQSSGVSSREVLIAEQAVIEIEKFEPTGSCRVLHIKQDALGRLYDQISQCVLNRKGLSFRPPPYMTRGLLNRTQLLTFLGLRDPVSEAQLEAVMAQFQPYYIDYGHGVWGDGDFSSFAIDNANCGALRKAFPSGVELGEEFFKDAFVTRFSERLADCLLDGTFAGYPVGWGIASHALSPNDKFIYEASQFHKSLKATRFNYGIVKRALPDGPLCIQDYYNRFCENVGFEKGDTASLYHFYRLRGGLLLSGVTLVRREDGRQSVGKRGAGAQSGNIPSIDICVDSVELEEKIGSHEQRKPPVKRFVLSPFAKAFVPKTNSLFSEPYVRSRNSEDEGIVKDIPQPEVRGITALRGVVTCLL